jgi:hypothetical protein
VRFSRFQWAVLGWEIRGMPAETPRSKLFKDKARKFRILAQESKDPALEFLVLAAAYEAMAQQPDNGDAAGDNPEELGDAA